MARLLSLEELKEYRTHDYLLWKETPKYDETWPLTPWHPANHIYCHLQETLTGKYIEFGGQWLSAHEYGRTWRCWEGEPQKEQRLLEPWLENTPEPIEEWVIVNK